MSDQVDEKNILPRFLFRGARLDLGQVHAVLAERLQNIVQRADAVFDRHQQRGFCLGRLAPATRGRSQGSAWRCRRCLRCSARSASNDRSWLASNDAIAALEPSSVAWTAASEVEADECSATPGKCVSSHLRHCASACACEYTAFTSFSLPETDNKFLRDRFAALGHDL